ncbi:MAG: DUF4249 domain-containing protein [Saprospiraceae bacterium]
MESKISLKLAWLAIIFAVLQSCEEPYLPSIPESTPQIVVEGYVEAGDSDQPVIVVLTKSIPYLSKVSSDVLAASFIQGATVQVNDQEKDVVLTEICLNDLPEEERKQALALLGITGDSIAYNICVYVDILDQIDRKIGGKYDLSVKIGDTLLTATTTIPQLVPLENFLWEMPPGKPNDTLAQLKVTINDPANQNDFYRYLTASQGGNLIPPLTSVTDDVLFDGQRFEFPLSKAEDRNADFDPDTFGYFLRNDSVSIKWCTIDKAHFDFWNTRDNAANSGGPFSSYTRIATNIKGGQGIWGGYAVNFYRLKVPEK